MDQSLQQLTEKIVKEGVNKAKQEADNILNDAKAKAEKIVSEAEKQAEKIQADTKKKAKSIEKKALTEAFMSAKQAMAEVKQQLTQVITGELSQKLTAAAKKDDALTKEIIVQLIDKFSSGGGSKAILTLSEETQTALKAKEKEIAKKGVTILTDKGLDSGFQLKPEGDNGFILSFTDDDFANFFKQYLKPFTYQLLFEN